MLGWSTFPDRQRFLTVLANLETCGLMTPELTANIDLQSLGCVLLECMDGRPNKELRTLSYVLEQRKTRKMFGLTNGDKWSEFKLLIDFLEELFNSDKPSIQKFDRPVSLSHL